LRAAQTVTVFPLRRCDPPLLYTLRKKFAFFYLNTGISEGDILTGGPVKSMGRAAALALPKRI
jgi:hypothetical protein